jgi:DNA polymerase-3 subunit delta'
VPNSAPIVSPTKPIRIISRLLSANTAPNALLFTGVEGTGRRQLAIEFAMAANCFKRGLEAKSLYAQQTAAPAEVAMLNAPSICPCGVCRSCLKILSGSHPDILPLTSSGTVIQIEQIRQLLHTLALKPYEARLRIVLIEKAHTMNEAAANALLKGLEEPPVGTMFILLATAKSELLPTIYSRCQHIHFHPVPTEKLAEHLVVNESVDPDMAKFLAFISQGSPTKAEALVADHWIDRYQWLCAALKQLPGSPPAFQLMLAAELARDKEWLSVYLLMLETWLRDLHIFDRVPQKIINRDHAATFENWIRCLKGTERQKMSARVQHIQSWIATNFNLRLATEVLLADLAHILAPCGRAEAATR